MKRRLDDGGTDIQTWMHFHTDEYGNEKFTIQNIQPTKNIIEQNKQAQRYYRENPQRGAIREVAEIPVLWQYQILQEHGIDVWSKDPEMKRRFRRLLDHPDYKFLRTDPMRLETAKGK
jgi:hypothetical protein